MSIKKIKGIDVSYHNEKINWNKVKTDGIKFTIIREGYRMTTDVQFFNNVKNAKAAGVDIYGVYHFSYALTKEQAREEAEFCVENVQKAGLDKSIIIFYDFEYDTVTKAKKKGVKLGSKECIEWTKAFCDRVTELGYTPGIYANLDYIKTMYKNQLIDKYILWYAQFKGSEPNHTCEIFQYSETGRVNGINGNVDMNWLYIIDDKEEKSKESTQTSSKSRSRDAVVKQARSWLGKKESDGSHHIIIDTYNNHKPLPRSYKVTYKDAWCATFVSAVAIKVGYTDIIPKECSCQRQIELFKKFGSWVENDAHIPKPGDIIYYDWQDSGSGNNTGTADHVGIVEKVDGSQITVIEGNKNDSVSRRTVNINGRCIRGYGVPKYTDDTISETKTESKSKTSSSNNKLNTAIKFNGKTTAPLNVRKWAGKENGLCSFSPLKKGAIVGVCDKVYAKDGSVWYYILYKGKYGFVSSKFVSKQ